MHHLRWQPFDVTTLRAPDGSITAKFVSFGATMTELWVRDRDGNARDVVLGYDDNVSRSVDEFYVEEGQKLTEGPGGVACTRRSC